MNKRQFKFIILALCALPLPSLAAEAVSKTNTYVVTGASLAAETVSKTNTYVVTGASQGKSFVSKVNAFAVTGVAPSKLQVSKMTVYVVVGPQSATNQPNIFITAMREPQESQVPYVFLDYTDSGSSDGLLLPSGFCGCSAIGDFDPGSKTTFLY
jgi:predicted secreted Zn-dependent protease